MKNAFVCYLAAGALVCTVAMKAGADSNQASESQAGAVAPQHFSKTSGRLESVNESQNKVVIRQHDGAPADFVLSGGSDINVDGRSAQENDLRPGQRVNLLRYDSSTHIIKRIETSTK